MNGPGAAVGNEREVTRVAALLGRDRPQGPGHAGVRDAVDAVGRLEHGQPERICDARHGFLGELPPDCDLTVGDRSGGHEPEHDVRVGDRRLDPPAAVARRPGSAPALRGPT